MDSGQKPALRSASFRAFDTSNAILAEADPALLEGAIRLCRHLEGLLSPFVEGSDVWHINHGGGRPVEVSESTAAVLSCAEEVRKASGGAFDIAVGQAAALWRPGADGPRPLAVSKTERLAKGLLEVEVAIDGLQVTVSPGGRIDLGGIAKGYICGQAASFLRERGVANALLNFGGNVVAMGRYPQGRPWSVGLQSPDNKREQGVFAFLEASDAAIVTSGVYERGFVVDGRLYHHILDPRTCRPAESGLVSASVIGDDSMLADALATAIVVAGARRGIELAARFGVRLVLLQDDGSLYYSPGLAIEPVCTTDVRVALPIV